MLKHLIISFIVLLPSLVQAQDTSIVKKDSLGFRPMGKWKQAPYTQGNGTVVSYDANAPQWPEDVLIQTFANESITGAELIKFYRVNRERLVRALGTEFYLIAVEPRGYTVIYYNSLKPEEHIFFSAYPKHHKEGRYVFNYPYFWKSKTGKPLAPPPPPDTVDHTQQFIAQPH